MVTHNLYFVALIPPKEIFDDIQTIKLYVSEKYRCRQALKSPPHITIEPPFRYSSIKEQLLCQKINELNIHLIQNPVLIDLNNYDVFLPKVVFIKVNEHYALTELYNTTHFFLKTELKITKELQPRPFHPHITIAFRDVKKQQIPLILQAVQKKFPMSTQFYINRLHLLKHDGKQWNIIL